MTLIFTNCKSKKEPGTPVSQEQNRKDRPQRGGDPFTEMDVNKDGVLTKAEAKGPLANDFAKLDLNNDGVISREEFDKAPKPQRREGGRPPQR